MNEEELDAMREALAARLDGCWDRLVDVVSELRAVHRVPTGQIVDRVVAAAEEEDGPQNATESNSAA